MADGAGVAVLVPMLGRPHLLAQLLESIRATAPAGRVLFLVSPDDDPVHGEIDRLGEERITVPKEPFGDYARKINTGYRHTTEPHLFCGAIDLRFLPGWYEAATAELRPGIGVVGTNDLGSPRVMRGEHSTHSLVTRAYADTYGTIDQPGAILHEGYRHEFADDELVGTARFRGAWAFASESYVEHRHPDWGKEYPSPDGFPDPIYAEQQNRMRMSAPLYKQRRRLWT